MAVVRPHELEPLRGRPLHVAMIAPPWTALPPPADEPLEGIVHLLCEAVVRRGHRVTLFAPAGSHSSATVHELGAASLPPQIPHHVYETDYVARALTAIDRAALGADPFDVVHNHSGFTALAFADHFGAPLVHTLHAGAVDEHTAAVYAYYSGRAHLVGTDEAQQSTAPALRFADVIPDPVDLDGWPYQEQDDGYVLWPWRLEALSGAHTILATVRAAQVPLVLAGPLLRGQERWFDTEIAPHLDGEHVRYVGPLTGNEGRRLVAAARAVLVPLCHEGYYAEMVQALACGTPVIATPKGSARQVVQPGHNGFLVEDEHELTAALGALETLHPADCRQSVTARFAPDVVAARYEQV